MRATGKPAGGRAQRKARGLGVRGLGGGREGGKGGDRSHRWPRSRRFASPGEGQSAYSCRRSSTGVGKVLQVYSLNRVWAGLGWRVCFFLSGAESELEVE